jgi:hypothetical protein
VLGSARPSVDIPGLPEWLQIVITVACHRFRAKVIKGPRVDYLGVMGRPGAGDDWVGVRTRGKLRLSLERPDGTTRALPGTPGQKRVPFDDCWTLYRRDGEWIVGSIQAVTARNEKTHTTEEFVGP